jgi:hypothetical protein
VKLRLWLAAAVIAAIAVPGVAIAPPQNHDGDRNSPAFTTHDRENLKEWYRERHDYPPPGFRYRDRLPAKLEMQLVVHEVLPKQLRRRIVPMPVEIVRLLPAPAPGCGYVALGGNIALIDMKTWMVHDFVHIELNP